MLIVTRDLPPAVAARAAVDFPAPKFLSLTGAFDPAAFLASAGDATAILCTPADRFDAALIAQLPASVRVIATFSVGLDHLDLAACEQRGIAVVNTPDVLSTATAELALTLMLMAARRAGEGERLLRAGAWKGLTPTFLPGRNVSGKVLGIFGMGRIGRELAAMARGLGMAIHYHNRTRLTPDLEAGAIFHEDDATFLAAIDFLSINAPGGPATAGWLNAARIAKLRPGSIVVNTGRGSTVDDEALIAALTSGHLFAAGLDVFNNEPAIHPGYLALENVVLLPHIGSGTLETRNAMGLRALGGIAAVLGGVAGQNPPGLTLPR